LPSQYATQVADPLTLPALGLMVLGLLAVMLLARFNPADDAS